jgi:hypothetical protein
VTLSTERLLLPPLTAEHAPELITLYADPEVARYVGARGEAMEIAPAIS